MIKFERIYPEAWNLERLEETVMPSFAIKSRVTSPITEATVDADSREKAIQQTVDAGMATEGSQVEVLNVEQMPSAAAPGVTGTKAEPDKLPPPSS